MMDTIVSFFKNLGRFFVSINANAFWSIVYWFSQNWFAILAIIFIAVMIYFEISIKMEHIVDDKREIY